MKVTGVCSEKGGPQYRNLLLREVFRAKKHGIIGVLESVAETSHGGIRLKCIRLVIQIFIRNFKKRDKKI